MLVIRNFAQIADLPHWLHCNANFMVHNNFSCGNLNGRKYLKDYTL